MKDVELLVSSLVQQQFPSFYAEEGETFIAFVKAYYEWLEQENNVTKEARSLMSYRDIDSTLTKFVENFQYKYLQGVPRQYTGDRRLLQKHIKEIYASKGTSRGLELLFRLLFNEDITVYFPGDDVIKPSDGDFVVPRYLEMQFNKNLPLYVGKTITGRISGATAIVNDYRYFIKENNRFDILYISNIKGRFQANEEIINQTVLDENNLGVIDSPIINGSLSDIIIVDGGVNFKVGDTFTVDSFKNGINAKAVITDVVQRAGFVTFDVRNGGYGFSNVSTLETAGFDEQIYSNYMPQITLQRTSADLTASGGSGTFTVDELVTGNISGASGLFVSESGGRVFLRRVEGNFTPETITGQDSGATRTFSGEDLVSEASFKIGYLQESQTRSLTGIRIEDACNVAVKWYRTGTDVIIKHPFHCLRDGDKVIIKTSSNTAALPANTTTPVTVTLTDLAYSVNSTAMYITANSHGYLGADQIIVRSASNTTLIPTEARFNVSIVNANVFSIPKTAAVANVGTVNINDFYTVTGLNAGATSGTATIDMRIDANNYGGFCDLAVLIANGSVSNSLLIEVPTIDMDIDEAIKFGNIEFGKIADERNVPSGLSSVFGGDGYKTNVLVSITDPIVYGLRIRGEPRTLSGLVTISGNVVTGSETSFTRELIIGSEVYSEQWGLQSRKVSAINSDTEIELDEAFKDNAGNELSDATPEPLLAVTYWGKIDFPATDSVDNADVFGIAGFGRGAANRLAVVDSGIGYQNGESLTLYYNKDTTRTISAVGVSDSDGKGEGFFRTNRSFLNSNKYIHDNRYYQEFSYEVQSTISFDKYSAILKEIWHPAGVSKFGRVVVRDIVELETDSVETEIEFV